MTELINIRDFNQEEKQEISGYIQSNVPFSVLQKTFPLTENIFDKASNFIACYRILNTSKNLVSLEETKEKLNKLLTHSSNLYIEIYALLKKEELATDFLKLKIKNKLTFILSKKENIITVNNLIDIFLILAEKFELMDLDKIAGLDLETDEGKNLYNELLTDNTNPNISSN